ncbi:MAG: glycosyltransferase [Bacteroidota bacterium]
MKEASDGRLLSIIIPIYNEEWCIIPTYNKIAGMADEYGLDVELIFIDDRSSDNSPAVLEDLAARDNRVKVVRFNVRCGRTLAIQAGIDYSSGDVIVTMDGNLQNDPNDILKMLDKLDEGWDVCSGWRQGEEDAVLDRDLPGRMTNFIVSKLSGVQLHDHSSSLKAYKRNMIKDVRMYGEMHRLLPVYASWQGARITEVPIKQYPRAHGHGERQSGVKRVIKTTLDLMLVQFLTRYNQRPMYLFGVFGFINVLIGFIATCLSIYYKLFGNKAFIDTPLPFLAVICVVIGGVCILMGFLAEILTRIYFESQNRPVYRIHSLRNFDQFHDPTV